MCLLRKALTFNAFPKISFDVCNAFLEETLALPMLLIRKPLIVNAFLKEIFDSGGSHELVNNKAFSALT